MTAVSRLGLVAGGRRSILAAYRRVPHNATARAHGSILDAARRLPGGRPIPIVVAATTGIGGATLPIPPGTAPGDLLVMLEASTSATRSGWVTLTSDTGAANRRRVRVRVSTVGESDVVLPGGSTAGFPSVLVSVRGTDPPSPISVAEADHPETTYTTGSVPARALLDSPSAGLALWLHAGEEDTFTMTLPAGTTRILAASALVAHAFAQTVSAGVIPAASSTIGVLATGSPAYQSTVVVR